MPNWVPIGEGYNVIWLGGVLGVALIAFARAVFDHWFVPKNPAFVEKCINTLHVLRQQLTAERPPIVHPTTGHILISTPEDPEELFQLLKFLIARHRSNSDIVRQITFVLYPKFRKGLKNLTEKTNSSIDATIASLSSLTEKDEADISDQDFEEFVNKTFKSFNAIIDFERAMLSVIDDSLECWSRRIAGN